MVFSVIANSKNRKEAGFIVIPYWEGQKKPISAAYIEKKLEDFTKAPISAGDFKGSEGETALIYLKGMPEKRGLLVGLGKQDRITVEKLRRIYSSVTKICQTKAITSMNLLLPNIAELRNVDVEECLQGICEGILLTNYRWEKLLTLDEETVLLKTVILIGVLPKMLSVVKRFEEIAEGVYFARDLINGNADTVTPQYLAQTAHMLAQKFPNLKATVFDKKRIEKEKMGLLLAVSRGSPLEPAFIILKYTGHARSRDHTVLVGKGVTFDTGGLNLKPTGSMETMRDDMSGAAAVLGAIAAAAALKLPQNITAVIAATENSIDGKSYKPGDVYKSYSGTNVEIGNTDAEGRLTLADALAYSIKNLAPTRIIDFATLTGSMVIALGDRVSGVFSNNDALATHLVDAGKRTDEHLWRMPLFPPYREKLKSDIADIKNIGGRLAGSITAALFLQEFIDEIPWAHIDIAGTAFSDKEQGYWPKNGVGFGVRLIVDFLQNLSRL